MAVADKAEGLAEAQRRIVACRETHSESLDLSNLGLWRVPEEIAELDWIRKLNLGGYPWEVGTNKIDAVGVPILSGLVNLTTLNLSDNRRVSSNKRLRYLNRLHQLCICDIQML